MNATLRLLIGWIFAVLLVAAWAWLADWTWPDVAWSDWSVAQRALLAGLATLGILLGNTLAFEHAVHPAARRSSLAQLTGLALSAALANLILPMKSGYGLRILYYHRRYHHPAFLLLGASAAHQFAWFGCAVAVLLVAGHSLVIERLFPITVTFALLALLIAGGVLVARRWGTLRSSQRLKQLLSGLGLLLPYRRSLFVIFLLGLAALALQAARLKLSFATIGEPVSLQIAFTLSAIATLGTLFHVTPGGIGIREGLIVLVSQLYEVPPDVALSAGLVDRAFWLGTVMVLGPPSVPWTTRRVMSRPPEQEW